MAVHYRTEAFLIKKKDWLENDQFLTFYTKDFGKVEVLGKAIRKINSKLRGGIEIFSLSNIEFIQGKNYKTLTDTNIIEKFPNLKKDLKKREVADKISQVLNDLLKEEEKDIEVWEVLYEVFKNLNDQNNKILNYYLLFYYFFWNIISVLGYQIDFYHCALCHRKIPNANNFFNLEAGGIICNNCFKNKKNIKEIPNDIIKILRIILKKDIDFLMKLKIEKKHLEGLYLISQEYLSYHI